MMNNESYLRSKYPELFTKHSSIEHPPGWNNLVDELCRTISEMIHKQPYIVNVDQTKQKYAGLRFYVTAFGFEQDADYTKLHEAVTRAEKLSHSICEECGKPGVRRNHAGWLKVTCDEHGHGYDELKLGL